MLVHVSLEWVEGGEESGEEEGEEEEEGRGGEEGMKKLQYNTEYKITGEGLVTGER